MTTILGEFVIVGIVALGIYWLLTNVRVGDREKDDNTTPKE